MNKSRRRSRISRDERNYLDVPLGDLLGDDGDIESYFKKNVVVKKPRDVFKKKTNITSRKSMILPAFQKSIVASTPIHGRNYTNIKNNRWNFSSIGSSLENSPNISYNRSIKNTSRKEDGLSDKLLGNKINVSKRNQIVSSETPQLSIASSKTNVMSGSIIVESKKRKKQCPTSKIPISKERKLIESIAGKLSFRNEDERSTSKTNKKDLDFNKSKYLQNPLKSPGPLPQTEELDKAKETKLTPRCQDISLEKVQSIARRKSLGYDSHEGSPVKIREDQIFNTSRKSEQSGIHLQNLFERDELLLQTDKVDYRRLRNRREESLYKSKKMDNERVTKLSSSCQKYLSTASGKKKYPHRQLNVSRSIAQTPKRRISKIKQKSYNVTGNSPTLFRSLPADELYFFSSDNEMEDSDINLSDKPKPSRFSIETDRYSLNRRSSVRVSGIMKTAIKVGEETCDERSNIKEGIECERRISLSPTENQEEVAIHLPSTMERILKGKGQTIETLRTYSKSKQKAINGNKHQVISTEELNKMKKQKVHSDLLSTSVDCLVEGDHTTSLSKRENSHSNKFEGGDKGCSRRSTRTRRQCKQYSVGIMELNDKNDLKLFSSGSTSAQIVDELIHSNGNVTELHTEISPRKCVLNKPGNDSLLTCVESRQESVLDEDSVKDLPSSCDNTSYTNALSKKTTVAKNQSTRFKEVYSSIHSNGKLTEMHTEFSPIKCVLNKNRSDSVLTSVNSRKKTVLNKDLVKDLPFSFEDTNNTNALTKRRRTILKNQSTGFKEGSSRKSSRTIKQRKEYSVGVMELTGEKDLKFFSKRSIPTLVIDECNHSHEKVTELHTEIGPKKRVLNKDGNNSILAGVDSRREFVLNEGLIKKLPSYCDDTINANAQSEKTETILKNLSTRLGEGSLIKSTSRIKQTQEHDVEVMASTVQSSKSIPIQVIDERVDSNEKLTEIQNEISPKKCVLKKNENDSILTSVHSQKKIVPKEDLLRDIPSSYEHTNNTNALNKRRRTIPKNQSIRFKEGSPRKSSRTIKQRKEYPVGVMELSDEKDLKFFSRRSIATHVIDERIHSNGKLTELHNEIDIKKRLLNKDGNDSLLTSFDSQQESVLNEGLVKNLSSCNGTNNTNALSKKRKTIIKNLSTRPEEVYSSKSIRTQVIDERNDSNEKLTEIRNEISPKKLKNHGNDSFLTIVNSPKKSVLNKDIVTDLPSSCDDSNNTNALTKSIRTILKNQSTRFKAGSSRKSLRTIKQLKEYSMGIIELAGEKDLKLFKDINVEKVKEKNIGSMSNNNTTKRIKLSTESECRKIASSGPLNTTVDTKSQHKEQCTITTDSNSLMNGVPTQGELVLLNLTHEKLRPLLEHGQRNVTDTIKIVDGEGIVQIKYCIPFEEDHLTLVREQFTATEPVKIFDGVQLRHIKVLPMNELHFNNCVKYDQLLKVVKGRGLIKVETSLNTKVFHSILIPKGTPYTIYNKEKDGLLIRCLQL